MSPRKPASISRTARVSLEHLFGTFLSNSVVSLAAGILCSSHLRRGGGPAAAVAAQAGHTFTPTEGPQSSSPGGGCGSGTGPGSAAPRSPVAAPAPAHGRSHAAASGPDSAVPSTAASRPAPTGPSVVASKPAPAPSPAPSPAQDLVSIGSDASNLRPTSSPATDCCSFAMPSSLNSPLPRPWWFSASDITTHWASPVLPQLPWPLPRSSHQP
mmetsp:Transcript_96762/g.269020  ORF Transcript_96762/g.269020 Transcript_96762/m.269020 type:complete len:213 (+) Transcript_96762:379-1017(+)